MMTRSTAAVAAIVAAATLMKQASAQACDGSMSIVAILMDTMMVTSDCEGKADGETCTAECKADYVVSSEGVTSTSFTCTTDTFVKVDGEGDLTCTGPCHASIATTDILNGAGVDSSSCHGTTADMDCTVTCEQGYETATDAASSTTFTCSSGSFVKKAGESDVACSAKACTTLPAGSNIDNSACNGKTTGETCEVACATNYTGTATVAMCEASGSFAWDSAAPVCTSAMVGGSDADGDSAGGGDADGGSVGGGDAEGPACDATGNPDLKEWFEAIAEHVTALAEVDGDDAKKDKFNKDMLPSLKTKICEHKAALAKISWSSMCDMITMQAMGILNVDSTCLCGGKCEQMWDMLAQDEEDDSEPFENPTAQQCRFANCYVTEACTAAGTNMEPMLDNLTSMVASKCGSYLSAVMDGAEPSRTPLTPVITAIGAGLMALF